MGCNTSPFELSADNGASFYRAPTYTLDAEQGIVAIELPAEMEVIAVITDLRYGFEGFPQCALYSGAADGNADSANAVPARPFRFPEPDLLR